MPAPAVYLHPSAMAGCVAISRMALGELRSHRSELPEHLALIVDEAYRVLEPMALPVAAYEAAAKLLHTSEHGLGTI
jgi:hypothetical protein